MFREYSVRVVAHNHNGPGMSTAEVVARTYSDTPSATPQNFTLEVSSATVSVFVPFVGGGGGVDGEGRRGWGRKTSVVGWT